MFFNFYSPTLSNSLQRLRNLLLGVSCTLLLIGCVGDKQSLIWDTFKVGIFGNDQLIDNAVLNPAYRYLRVDLNGRSALMVLGYESMKAGAVTQTWYSSHKELVQFDNGRLFATGGLDLNWVDVALIDAPDIRSPELFPNASNSLYKPGRNPKFYFFRTRTVMPQYLANIHEAVVIQGLNEAPEDAPELLRDRVSGANLRWVQETVVLQPNNPSVHPLRAIYAYDTKTNAMVFGRQCLSQTSCLSWFAVPVSVTPSNNLQAGAVGRVDSVNVSTLGVPP